MAHRLEEAIRAWTRGLADAERLAAALERGLALSGPPPGDPAEADTFWVQLACHHLPLHPDFDRLAVRAALSGLYREALAASPAPDDAAALSPVFALDAATYRSAFVHYIRQGIELGELDPRLASFDLARLARLVVPARDELIPYAGLATLMDRYLVRHPESRRLLETPQYLWMRVAMGLALAEAPDARDLWAARFYRLMSTLRYVPSTPTLFNAGTTHPQLSSCYLSDVLDSMDHILESATDFGYLAKYAGGIGASITKLRSAGSPVRGINGQSSGIVPFAHMYDALIKAVSQGGRRRGTLALYLEPWHLEIEAFLDLKRNAGDPYLRTPSLDTALWVPDEFLRRVEADEAWYLFDPRYVPELPELFGQSFGEAYEARIRQARAGQLPARAFREVSARGLFREILATLQETSHPWIVFKDAGNARSMLPGVIHSSNLCTEIFLPTSPQEIAVCNLGSVNLARHLRADPAGPGRLRAADVDWPALQATVELAVRALDDVIDVNFYPVDKARRSNLRHRPVGLGIMGFAEAFARLGMAYGDPASADLVDRVVEFVSFHAIRTSARLARERGSFAAFSESRWAQGRLPLDTLAELQSHRGRPVEVDSSARLPWDTLRPLVRGGMRNGTVMAIAPTATISLVAGTTPSLDPYYANVFARQTLSGKFMEVNRVLVDELEALRLWEDVRERIVAERGDLSAVEEIPEPVRRRYPTAYRIPPEAYVELAARAQKWVDMGISRNLFLQSRDLDAMAEVYLAAWRKGLKSTYYLFMAPRMYAEPSTVQVNKARRRPRWSFLEAASTNGHGAPGEHCALDGGGPGCESCQ